MDELTMLRGLRADKLSESPPNRLDPLYQGLIDNLHLELHHEETPYLISPAFQVLRPANHPAALLSFIKDQRTLLERLRPLLVHNLLVYSFLVETHSYYLEQNQRLLIARLAALDRDAERLEIRYYTNSPRDLLASYSDKIYVGRDFVTLGRFTRAKLGLEDHLQSLMLEIEELKQKAVEKLHQQSTGVETFLVDIESIGEEFLEQGLPYLRSLPASFVFEESHDGALLIDFLANARRLKHFLVEIDGDVNELVDELRRRGEVDFIRYAVKFQTDVQNLIELLNVKVIAQGVAALRAAV